MTSATTGLVRRRLAARPPSGAAGAGPPPRGRRSNAWPTRVDRARALPWPGRRGAGRRPPPGPWRRPSPASPRWAAARSSASSTGSSLLHQGRAARATWSACCLAIRFGSSRTRPAGAGASRGTRRARASGRLSGSASASPSAAALPSAVDDPASTSSASDGRRRPGDVVAGSGPGGRPAAPVPGAVATARRPSSTLSPSRRRSRRRRPRRRRRRSAGTSPPGADRRPPWPPPRRGAGRTTGWPSAASRSRS